MLLYLYFCTLGTIHLLPTMIYVQGESTISQSIKYKTYTRLSQSILYAPTEPLCFQFRSCDIKEIKLN